MASKLAHNYHFYTLLQQLSHSLRLLLIPNVKMEHIKQIWVAKCAAVMEFIGEVDDGWWDWSVVHVILPQTISNHLLV